MPYKGISLHLLWVDFSLYTAILQTPPRTSVLPNRAMDNEMSREQLLAALIAQKLSRADGGFSIERAVWLSALEVGITLEMPETSHTFPKDDP